MVGKAYDLIGIGIGPFNLGLACLVEPIKSLDCLFLERNGEFNWHGGTLIEDATLQTPFLSDLVTLADPASRFSLLSYMKQTGQIYAFYAFLLDTANFFLPRNTFNAYYRWAAEQLDSLVFNRDVISVEYDEREGLYRVHAVNTRSDEPVIYHARRLVLGTGMAPAIPRACAEVAGQAIHSSAYLQRRDEIKARQTITLIGSGQSAAEIFRDLLSDIDRHDYRLRWVTRSPRLIPRELTKQTLQMTTPDYTDYFFTLPKERRTELVDSLKAVYQGINPDLINEIFDLRYRKLLTGRHQIELIANSHVTGCSYDVARQEFELEFEQRESGEIFGHSAEALVLGTGYRWPERRYLEPVRDRINWCEGERFMVARNCSIDRCGNEIFVPNAEIHADSFIPPDLGQACHRNSIIIREVLGDAFYPVEDSVAFQQFRPSAAPPSAQATMLA